MNPLNKLNIKSKKLLRLSDELKKQIDVSSSELRREVEILELLKNKKESLVSKRSSILTTIESFSSGYMFNAFNYKLKLTEDINDVELNIVKQGKRVSKARKVVKTLSVKKIAAEKIIERLRIQIENKLGKIEDSEIESFCIVKSYMRSR